MNDLYISMQTAARIFGEVQADPEREIIGVLHDAGLPGQRFDTANAGLELGEHDIPVIHSERLQRVDSDCLLTVITDTRGVMQLHAYERVGKELRRIEIHTEKD